MPVTRTLVNTGNPLITPDGELYANKTVTFQLVKADNQRPISLFDATNGEFIVGELITATTDEAGLFSQPLWPNTRGGDATYYLVSMPESSAKSFLIRVTAGSGSMLLIDAKAGVLPVPPAQTLTLFEALLASISAIVEQATNVATTTVNGLMSAVDKVRLDTLWGYVSDVTVVRTSSGLAAAVAAAGSTKRTIKYTVNQTLTANLAIPATIELIPLNGASITVGAYSLTGLKTATPEMFGAVGDNVTMDTAAVNAAMVAADEVYLAREYPVTFLTTDRPVRFTGPGRIRNTTVNKHIVGYLEGTGEGVQIIGGKFGPMPAGSTTDFAAIYTEDAKQPIIAFSNFDEPNNGVRFGYTATDQVDDALLLGSHIHGAQSMAVENIDAHYTKIIANSVENAGVLAGTHGVRVSGTSKGVIGVGNSIRDRDNVASFQLGAENSVFVGNYGENNTYGFRDQSTETFDGGRHLMEGNVLKDTVTDAYSLLYGTGYRVGGIVDGSAGQGLTTATTASGIEGKHRIDLSIFDTASTSLNLRNGKNLVTVIVDGTTGGTPVAIGGNNNMVLVLVTGTSLTNTVYITGNNNVVILSESGTATTALRIDGSSNHVSGRITGNISLVGDDNVVNLIATSITISAGADNNKVSGKFSGTITNNGTRNDLTGIYEYNLILVSALPTSGTFPRKVRLENTANTIGQPKGWRVTTVGGAYSYTRDNNTMYASGTWVQWTSGATVWECTTAGTSAGSPPDITGKVVGDTVTDSTAVWTLRSLTTAVFTSEGNL